MDDKGDIYTQLVEMVEKPTWKSLLIDTVKSSGLDPWDIDIGKLAGMFAERIKRMRENNLRVPANAILASSILLRFKSDNWVFFPSEEEEEDEGPIVVGKEKVEIPELPPIKRVTKRRVTLDDLIKAIEDVMEKEIRKRKKSRSTGVTLNVNPLQVLRDSFFDSEELENTKRAVWIALNQKKDDMGLVLFSDILPDNDRMTIVKILLSILHLANENKVFLWQEDFFDEILIKVNDDE